MKILLIHQHFNKPETGGPLRSWFFARWLSEQGHETHVLTGHPGAGYRTEFVEGILIHYLPVSYDNSFPFYRRVRAFLTFVWKAISLRKKFSNVDVVYAMSVPLTVGLIALAYKRFYGIPFVLEVGDLWPDAPVELGILKNRLFIRWMYKLERLLYRESKSLVAVSEPIAAKILERVQDKQVDVIPNISDTGFLQPTRHTDLRGSDVDIKDKFVISYVGAIGYANGLSYLLDCAAHCQSARLPVHFLVCGKGAMLETLKARAAAESLKNVSFLPFRNREGVKKVFDVTDAAMVCFRREKILETGAPHKYFDGLAAGKLIIVNFRGWIREEIESEQCGVYSDVPEKFPELIKPFIDDQQRLQVYQRAARELAVRKYSSDKLGQEFLKMIEGFGAPTDSD